MPETANHKIPINLNLLKPQSESPKNVLKLIHWVLFAGRYIVVVVEIIVLAAFLMRFKLDADIADTQERIDEKAEYIQSLSKVEKEVRQTQFQLGSVTSLKGQVPDFVTILKHVSDQTPTEIFLANLSVESAEGNAAVKITGDAKDNNQVLAFTQGLQGDSFFSEANLTSIGLEQNVIKFIITTVVRQGETK